MKLELFKLITQSALLNNKGEIDMIIKEVLGFNKLCPKDWGKYDPRKPINMKELNNEKEKEHEEGEIGE